MNKKRVIVVSGGEIHFSDFSIIHSKDTIVAADYGVISLLKVGIRPDIAVGDFDTVGEEGLRKIREKGILVHSLSKQKSETDTHFALRIALQYQPHQIVILGALGGPRFDHMLANIGLLEWINNQRVAGVIIYKSNRIFLLSGPIEYTLYKDQYTYISIIPITSMIEGVTTEGLCYPLSDETLYRGFTQGISNEWIKETATLTIKKGKCLIIQSNDSNDNE
jgi:thiamine pyrophosphokinase